MKFSEPTFSATQEPFCLEDCPIETHTYCTGYVILTTVTHIHYYIHMYVSITYYLAYTVQHAFKLTLFGG